MSDEHRPPEADLYGLLAEPFTVIHTRPDGLDYITGEQCITRLNETLGFLGWSFRILEHGIHAEADEVWVMGELTVINGDRTVVRQQFGSQKVKRSRSSGTPLDIGFDLKGASTDAMKKCAMSVGVALHLSEKEPAAQPAPRRDGQSNSGPTPIKGNGPGSFTSAMQEDGESFTCEDCTEPLTETRFKDGTNWSASQLAVFGRRKHSRILCMTHYREANQAKRRAEEALQQVPF